MNGKSNLMTSVGLLILRVGIGGYMLTHGWGKVQMLMNGQYDMMGDPIGLGPKLSLFLVTFAEFGCAVLVIFGLATRLAAIPIAFAMCVAAFVAMKAYPWTADAAGKAFFAGTSKDPFSREAPMMFLIPMLALVFTGGGRFSLDAVIGKKWHAKKAASTATDEK